VCACVDCGAVHVRGPLGDFVQPQTLNLVIAAYKRMVSDEQVRPQAIRIWLRHPKLT